MAAKAVTQTDEQLLKAILHVKNMLIETIDRAVASSENFTYFQVNTFMQLGVINTLEQELKSRGYDPTDEIFGRDVLAEIIEVMKGV